MNEIAVGDVKSAVSGFQETIFTGQELMLLVLHNFSERYPEHACVCVWGNEETITIGYGDQNASHTCVLYAQFCGRRQNGCV